MAMDTTAAKSTEELDAQLVSTLREIDSHNYAYLFERCKLCNVNAGHLRFFKKDQIHELIPKSELGILAEFEYLLNLWQISKGYTSFDTKIQLNPDNDSDNLLSSKGTPQAQSNTIIAKETPHVLCNNQTVVVAKQAIDIKPISINLQGPQISSPAMVADEPDELLTVLDSDENSKISNAKRMKFDEDDDEEEFTLETIIPEILKELKDSYESKNSLSTNERRLLCSSIVDYFESRKIEFSSYTMDELAEQIVEHFPTEDKKSWFNRGGPRICGRFYFRLRYLRRDKTKQTSNTPTSKVTLETIIPELLKELKDSYESKNSLSTNERRFLCSSIVDYFESRKIKFSSDTMSELAEQIVEHFPTEDKKSWCNRNGFRTSGRLIFRLRNSCKTMAKQTNNTSTSKVVTNSISSENEISKISNAKRMQFDENDEEKFTLETIIPELLKELKDSYESKDSLSRNERSLLCGSVVDYFVSRKIKFTSDTKAELAEQIVEHFPTEDRKSWCNRDGPRTRGRFCSRLRNSRRNMTKQTNNTSTSIVVTNSTSSEDEYDEEQFTLEIIIPGLLKELKDSYESKNSLSMIERRLLCSSIVDYFESRKIKFSTYTMDDLAEQIVEHFPTEDKKSWCNREGSDVSGRIISRLRYLRNKIAKQTATNFNSREKEDDEEKFTLETIIPELLKELKDSYESKYFLSRKERRLLCSSIVDYFESRELKLSSNTMDELAEQISEHFPTEDKKSWCNRDGPRICGSLPCRLYRSRSSNMTKQTSNTSTSKVTLETIIPELLKELKDSYESKDSLSKNERRLLCSSIVDYFESRELKFSSDTMAVLAEQISEHFPTEDKKSWYSRDGPRTSGSLPCRLYRSRFGNMTKQTNNTSTSKVVTNSALSEDENSKVSNAKHMKFDDEEKITLETIIPELLKELKDSYESKNSFSRNERSLLCGAIVDYFVSRKIKFTSDTMDELAEQIVEHFPTEDKKSWCNRDGYRTCGRFYSRVHYLRRDLRKQTKNTPTLKVTLETIIPELLKELKDSYESKNSLSTSERSLLCRAIEDYFVSRKIEFSSDTKDELAEQIVEHFPTEDEKSWCNRDGPRTCGSFYSGVPNSRTNMANQTNNTSTSKVLINSASSEDEDDQEKFTLETIIPELLKELKDSYESKNSLSTNERRFLCSSIVDYFESRKIEFSSYTMDELAEQIVEHFPKEDKKSWYNSDGLYTRGRLFFRLRYSRNKMAKQTSTNSISNEDEYSKMSKAKRMKFDEYDEEDFTLETIIPELLKELKDSYESKDFLSANERRFLCNSIVDYFESRKIKFISDTMDVLAEQIVEHFPTEDKKSWCSRYGPRTCGRFYFRLMYVRKNAHKQTNNTSTSKVTLETIIPELLKELKDSYESKDSLSRNERSLLCGAIVDYFESRELKFSSDTMSELAEQIVEYFPTEDKKSWCNRDGYRTCGRLYSRVHNSRRNMAKQTNNTSTSKVVTNFASSEDENSKVSNAKHMMKFDDEEKITLETIIPELLKELKDSYESKNSLSRNERSLLCSSIVDYFVSRKIKFTSDTMDVLAEQIVEHFPTEDKKSWCNRDGVRTHSRFYFRLHYLRRDLPKQTKNTPTSKVTLETIIPELLKELKDSYESKYSLSTIERRLLCSSIVDYFESRELKFSSDTMDELAEQIVEHFPTEDKKSWYNGNGSIPRGQLFYRLRYVMSSRYKMAKETNDTCNLKAVINSTSSEPEPRVEVHDEDSKSIQAWLKSHKCENFSEIIDLWKDTIKYRCWQSKQLKDLDSIREFLNDWPSYKLQTGHELLTMDFQYLYPQAMETFRKRWLVYKQNIEQFLKVELKDVNCIKLLEKYQLQKATIDEDSSACILIYLVHAITKPLRHFEAVSGNVSYATSDSQHSMMRLIRHKVEIDEYTEPYPCIFIVGDSMLEVQECYVVFMDLRFKLSYENCLAACVQIITVLNVEGPPASQCFWEFIRGYMFNITKNKEKFNGATENMVNYLQTAASGI